MIDELMPPGVSVAEAFQDTWAVALFPQEEAMMARAVSRRRAEFATGRACARAALTGLGVAPAPILAGPGGAPQWPAGIVGSITHCAGYRAAAVARTQDIRTLGLDAEPNNVLPDGVLDLIATAGELAWLAKMATAVPAVHWDRLLFSAKESVYKAWFPLTQRWLGFEQASITVEPEAGTFNAALLVPVPALNGRPLTEFSGRWLVRAGLVLTSIAVPA